MVDEEDSEDDLPEVQLGSTHDMNENKTNTNAYDDCIQNANMSTDTVSQPHYDSNVSNSFMTNSSNSYNHHPNLDNAGETGHQITIDIILDQNNAGIPLLQRSSGNVDDDNAVLRNDAITSGCMIKNIDVDREVNGIIEYCIENNVNTPIEIIRALQLFLVQGRPLEISDVNMCSEGETNFILVNRNNLLLSAFDEIKSLKNKFIRLEVQYYEEVCFDIISIYNFLCYLCSYVPFFLECFIELF